jgi:hypothetical protein
MLEDEIQEIEPALRSGEGSSDVSGRCSYRKLKNTDANIYPITVLKIDN